MKKLIVIFFLAFFLPLFSAQAEQAPMDVYIFTQTGCPHCAKALSLLEELKNNGYPEIVVHEFDMKAEPTQVKKLIQFANVYKADARKVPVLFIGTKAISGFLENSIKEALEYYHLPVNSYPNPQNIVDEYYKTHPDPIMPAADTAQTAIIGWMVLGVVVVGGGVVVVNKFF